MKLRPILAYVAATTVAAILALVLQDWSVLGSLSNWDLLGLGGLALLGVISEAISLSVRFGRSASQSTLTFIPILAAVLLFGPSAGVLLAAVILSVSEFILHKKPKIRSVFNVSQWVVVSALSGLLFQALHPEPLPESYPPPLDDGWLLIPFGAYVLSLFAGNYLAVAGAITLDSGRRFTDVMQRVMSSAGGNLIYGILISPLAFVVAVLYVQFEFQIIGLIITLLPLFFIRLSYLNNLKLQRANRDLLKALVKAIETRDPYTSGHSVRVSALARKIAGNMHLNRRQIENIETAALLHDIGKIEATYTEILRKPDSLSDEERAVIESHVTKGVELLQSLSSFSPSVIAAVRHHHEREDGKGYPDRLKGAEIPLGAKIIKVCDAVDAMLSDRPYREALQMYQVREQLTTYSGTQFDAGVVATLVEGDLLERHRDEVQASKEASPLSILDEGMEENVAARQSRRTSTPSWNPASSAS